MCKNPAVTHFVSASKTHLGGMTGESRLGAYSGGGDDRGGGPSRP